jgi:hypothetical protein
MEAESFDKKIRELLDGADFPYQEADWLQAQALLQKERKRKGLWWLWLLPALVGGTAWWMLMPSQAEMQARAEVQALVHVPMQKSNTTTELLATAEESAALVRNDKSSAKGRAKESATLPPATSFQRNNRDRAPVALNNQAAEIASSAVEVAERPGLISYLLARKVHLQSTSFEKSAPTERPVEPLLFERPQGKSAPVWALGLYAASQPNWNVSGERGAGSLNWQAGTFAAVQFDNGFYGQLLVGMQQQGLRNWNYVNTVTTYDFGFERTTQTLELRDYWTLQNALQLGYARGKHRVYGALSYQHYLFSRYRLDKQIERQDATPVIQAENGIAAWPQAGIQRFSPGLGYQYEISPAFRLGLQYQFKNESNGLYALPTVAPWQFSLQYHLFQRQQP